MATTTRAQIVDAADRLFYEQGYESTSFADIAAAVRISRGNFYHHFRSKDEILDAVIDARAGRTRGMLAAWTAAGGNPQERILLFVEILLRNQAKIMRHGCPVGTLCTELGKEGHPARGRAAGIFTLLRAWLRRQFELMGCAKQADAFALHVLGFTQGVAVLAQALHDENYVHREVELMRTWMRSIAPPYTAAGTSP